MHIRSDQLTPKMAFGKSIIWLYAKEEVNVWSLSSPMCYLQAPHGRQIAWGLLHTTCGNTFWVSLALPSIFTNFTNIEFQPMFVENKNQRVSEVIVYYNQRLFFFFLQSWLPSLNSIYPSFLSLFAFPSFFFSSYSFKVKHP